MSSLSIGLSGLLVNQRLIDLTGQNIANADNPNYHRQVGELAARTLGAPIGAGVELKSITRVIDRLLEDAIIRNTSAQSGAATTLTGLQQIEAILAPGEGSLHDTLTNFFNAAEQLSARPDDLTLRRVFLFAAHTLTDRLNAAVEGFSQLRGNLIAQAKTSVEEVNSLATQIAQLNQRIHSATASGEGPNALLDQRDQTVANLAKLIDVRVVPQEFGVVNVFAGGTSLVLGPTSMTLEAKTDTQNKLAIRIAGSTQSIDVGGGSLAGILSLSNSILPDLRARLDAFANAFVTQIDHIQATGLGLNGPLTSLTSQRVVPTTNLPLAVATLAYPVTAGDLYFTVTDFSTGERVLNQLNIDPATQSLSDVANAISTIPNVQAVVDPQAGTLTIMARPGYGFDFTGNFSMRPDTQVITGTATPTLSGRYTGNANDTLDFRFVGSGTIGVTPGLALEVRNAAGVLLTSLDVGQGYEVGTSLPDIRGVKVALSSGTVNAGDSFGLNVAANSDTSGLLPALGLNSFFVGNGAAGVQVNPDLFNHPENLAVSISGLPGDGSNLARLITLRDQLVLEGGSQSFQQNLEDILGNAGSQTQDMQTRKSAFDILGQQLDLQRQSVSGIDPNEELIKLVQYQRSYQSSAHFISVVNQTMDDLFRMLGP